MLIHLRRPRWAPRVSLVVWMAIAAVGPQAWLHPPDDAGCEAWLAAGGVAGDVNATSVTHVTQRPAHCAFCHTLRSSQPGEPVVSVVAVAASPAAPLGRNSRPAGTALAPATGRSPPA